MPNWKALGIALAVVACAAAQSAEDEGKALPEAAGREVTAKVCLNCHESAAFRKVRLDRDEWEHEVGLMVDNGAKATDAELATIVDYLVENFGPKSKIHINTAPLAEIKAVLGLTAAQAGAVVDYRGANGPFKAVEDLLKVPQIDAGKVEAHKDLLAF